MRSILFIVIFALVALAINAHQMCFPIGFKIVGEPWAANSIISATACAFNGSPAGNVDINHNNQINFIFDPQIGTVDSVSSPVVTHQTGYTAPSYPISSSDFTSFIDPINPSKVRIKFTPSYTEQIAVNDTICVDFTFATLGAGTYPVSFFSGITGFGTNVPSSTITVQ